MGTTITKPTRRQQILESLAYMLEENKGARITTARLAKEVGVSEAALYRHFPSKARMFESLLEFIEESIFTRINIIVGQSAMNEDRAGQIIHLVLTFASRNPGISRILTGEALTGEEQRLRLRVAQLFNRLEVQLKQVLASGQRPALADILREFVNPQVPHAERVRDVEVVFEIANRHPVRAAPKGPSARKVLVSSRSVDVLEVVTIAVIDPHFRLNAPFV